MTEQVFKTRITELFGIRHPLVCGGMMWLSNADYVGAVARAGGIGFITPRSFPTPEDFRAELRKCREIAEGAPFGVNLYISARPEANELLTTFLDVSIEEGVRFVETAGYSPKGFMPKIKDAGITIVHKCTTLRHAQSAERAGVDAVTILGAEAGGHPGMDMIGTMVQGAVVPHELTIPVILAGGMGTGRQLVAALALGADAILLASRMIVSSEIWAHENYKRHVAGLEASNTQIIMSIFGDNSRVIDTDATRAVLALEADGVTDFEAYRPHVQGANQKLAYETGEWAGGTMSLGQSCQFAGDITPVADIFADIIAEAALVRDRVAGLGA